MKDGKYSEGVIEEHKIVREILKQQVRLIDYLIAFILIEKKKNLEPEKIKTFSTIMMMIQGIGVSANSILKLTEDIEMSIRDCYGIARSILETSINVCYIISEGKSKNDLAVRHAEQRAFRNLKKENRYGNIIISAELMGIDKKKQIPDELKKALAQFSTKKGKEIREWTSDSVETRIEVISKYYPRQTLTFALSHAMIYRTSSEILHGTYFSVIFFWNGDNGRNEDEYVGNFIFKTHFANVFYSTIICITGLIEILAKKYEFDLIREKHDAIFNFFKRYIEMMQKEGEKQ